MSYIAVYCVIVLLVLVNLVSIPGLCDLASDSGASSQTLSPIDGTTLTRKTISVRDSYIGTEGEGFPIERPFPVQGLSDAEMDPFLLFDHMGPKDWPPGEAKGAPWHPHRGFETVTYLVEGEFMHRDSMGSKGTLRPGDVQWMTAGSGIIHHEVPTPNILKDGGIVEGFQLWVNLPRSLKMTPPRYQDVPKEKIPVHHGEGFEVVVISGHYELAAAVIDTYRPIEYLDFHALRNGATFSHTVDPARNGFIFVYRGEVMVNPKSKTPQRVRRGQSGIFRHDGSLLDFEALDSDTRFLLLSGEPLREPVAHQGPFVMNTREELQQAFDDYRNNRLVQHKAVFESRTDSSD
jgi:redox-sensitive bicupin YhaK (pirin superfamily)